MLLIMVTITLVAVFASQSHSAANIFVGRSPPAAAVTASSSKAQRWQQQFAEATRTHYYYLDF